MTARGPSEASERAIEAARAALSQNMDACEAAAEALDAAHDPALGLDCSVCLRDVAKFARSGGPWMDCPAGGQLTPYELARAIETRFAEQSVAS